MSKTKKNTATEQLDLFAFASESSRAEFVEKETARIAKESEKAAAGRVRAIRKEKAAKEEQPATQPEATRPETTSTPATVMASLLAKFDAKKKREAEQAAKKEQAAPAPDPVKSEKPAPKKRTAKKSKPAPVTQQPDGEKPRGFGSVRAVIGELLPEDDAAPVTPAKDTAKEKKPRAPRKPRAPKVNRYDFNGWAWEWERVNAAGGMLIERAEMIEGSDDSARLFLFNPDTDAAETMTVSANEIALACGYVEGKFEKSGEENFLIVTK